MTYAKYCIYLDGDFSDDFWSDVGIPEAGEMLFSFDYSDWRKFLHHLDDKSLGWQLRCAETLGDVENAVVLEILLRMMSSSNHDVAVVAADSLNSMAPMGFKFKPNEDFITQLRKEKNSAGLTGRLVIDSLKRYIASWAA